jgi:HEPN domain-containing protein
LTNTSLAQACLAKARARLRVLDVLLESGARSDVLREAQELVELALKGMLRQAGIEPPKWHDVGGLLLEHAGRFPSQVRDDLDRLAAVSGWLRKERELAFYGDIDFIPTERYGEDEARRASEDARFVVGVAGLVIPPEDSPRPS